MFKCPFCGYKNIAGNDECESCQADLSGYDGLDAKSSRLAKEVLGKPLSILNPREAVCVKDYTPLKEAVKRMNEIGAGCVLVENQKGKIVGIITERDILLKLPNKNNAAEKIKVSDIMTQPVEVLKSENSVAYAMHQMSVNRFRHVPIINQNGQASVLSVRDVLKYLTLSLGSKPKKKTVPKTKKGTKSKPPKIKKTKSSTKKKLTRPSKKKPSKGVSKKTKRR